MSAPDLHLTRLAGGEAQAQRQAKWCYFYQASGGRIFDVCDNRYCMRNICSEINYCLGN